MFMKRSDFLTESMKSICSTSDEFVSILSSLTENKISRTNFQSQVGSSKRMSHLNSVTLFEDLSDKSENKKRIRFVADINQLVDQLLKHFKDISS